jgi:hypothetical protein
MKRLHTRTSEKGIERAWNRKKRKEKEKMRREIVPFFIFTVKNLQQIHHLVEVIILNLHQSLQVQD